MVGGRVRRSSFCLAGVVLLAMAWTLGAPTAKAESGWSGLRGPNHDGGVHDARLFDGGDATLTLGWKRELGPGYSALSVADGRVVALFTSGDDDVAAAFDSESGEELWRYRIAERYAGHDGSHDGPISTPLIEGGRVYGLGAWGHLFALDAASGKPIWSTDLRETYKATEPHYGFTTSPLLVDGVLVVQIGAHEQGQSIAGFKAEDGTLLWSHGDEEIHYHSPIVAEIGGRKQVLAAGTKTVAGIEPGSGKILWSHEHGGDDRAMGGATIIPVTAGEDRVFLMNKIDSSTMLSVKPDGDGYAIEEAWSNNAIKQSYVIPVYVDGHLYGMNNRILVCVDADTGKTKWRSREPGDGFPIVVGNHLVMMTKPGSLHVIEASPEAYRDVASLELFEEHSWSTVAYADGELFARSMNELARIDPVAAAADRDTGESWIAGTEFGRFLAEAGASADPAAAVERFMAAQASFPIVESSGAVHFVFRGEAQDVGIVGDMIGFRREDPMVRLPGTDLFHYSIRLEPDAAVTYGYIVDFGEATPDPLNEAPGSGLFGDVSWFAMPAWQAPDFIDEADASRQGRLEALEWESQVREGQKRAAQVYLPAGYDANGDRRYPTVYIHDGQSALDGGAMKASLDNLLGHSVDPVIAVFILLDPEDPRGDTRETETFAQMIAEELVPRVDERYHTLADRNARASVGAGRAAGTALYLAFHYSELFGRAGGQSALMGADDAREVLDTKGNPPMVLYLDWGSYHMRSPHEAWDLAEENRGLWAFLRERGYRPAGGELPEGFGWSCWRGHTDELLTALFPRRN